jgi:hypothetical protein
VLSYSYKRTGMEKIYEDMHAPPHTSCRVSAVILPIC